jgi:hypothetical protein
MALHESNIFTRTSKRLSELGARLFRNNVGSAYTGPGMTLKPGQHYTGKGGERVIFAPRLIAFGLHKGSGDGIGWVTRTVTPDMIGQRVAVFLSVETKTDTGRTSEEQQTWLANVARAGGLAIVTNNDEEAAQWLMTQIEHKK